MIENELHQITQSIPDIRWICIVGADGLSHPTYRFDEGSIRRDTALDREEDRGGAISAAGMGLLDRMLDQLVLGSSQFMVLSGQSGMYFLLPIGDGSEWWIAFVVKGHPSIDPIIKYFEDRQYLANILPFL